MNLTGPIYMKSQLLNNITWMCSVPNYVESAKRYKNCMWKFIYALMTGTEPISNKLTSS